VITLVVAMAATLAACGSDDAAKAAVDSGTPDAGTPDASPDAAPDASPSDAGSDVVPGPITCTNGNRFELVNQAAYTIWLAEGYQGPGDLAQNIIVPPGDNWEMPPGASVSLCMPPSWSGRFWARTECRFDELFKNDPGYGPCAATSECDSGHVCYGGRCMLECTSGSTPFCQGASGLGNAKAICSPSDTKNVSVCTYPQGTVCKTGDCEGLYQCYGVWDGKPERKGSGGPFSLFESTTTGITAINYDVSLVSGYNIAIKAEPSISTCSTTSCTSDLNASCPPNLQLTEAPGATGQIPCGNGTYCQSGVCANNSICVVACNDPGDQCAAPNPPADLRCGTAVPGGDGSTYDDMYAAKNASKTISATDAAMSSGNQGTPTCWGDVDCPPGESCKMGLVSTFPASVGICIGSTFLPQPGCASQADVGKACGGYSTQPAYPNALGYKCVAIANSVAQVACVPPSTSGLGTPASNGSTTLFSATASPVNAQWLEAATQAGGGTPWYETFSQACPHQYGWQYDDLAGDLACDTGANGAPIDMKITFGLKGLGGS
jgi:hypothetical protein